MIARIASSAFQQVIEAVEALPPDDQLLLVEIISERLIQGRRAELARDIAEARMSYRNGQVQRGTVQELLRESKVGTGA
jgi:hypothetical protein